MKTHKRQTPSKLLGRQSLGGGISRFTPMEKGGGLKPALWSRGLWRRIKRQRRRGLERQEASSKRCWSQKENKREGPKKDGHRRRKDPWMRRQKAESIPRLSMGPIPKFAPPPRPKPKEGEPGWRGPVKTPPIKPSSALRMEAAVPMPKPTRPKEGAAPGSSSSTRTSWRT